MKAKKTRRRLDEAVGADHVVRVVRPDASWRHVPLGYRLRRIDTVETGGQYLRGLTSVAGRGPTARAAATVHHAPPRPAADRR